MQKKLSSYLYSTNADFIESLYESYLTNSNSVPAEWRKLFESFNDNESNSTNERRHSEVRQHFLKNAGSRTNQGAVISHETSDDNQKQVSVLQLINAHRFRGHQQANLDPLNQYDRPPVPELDPAFHNLNEADFDKTFNTVIETDYVDQQNCTGQKCKDCLLCYKKDTTSIIVEKVKTYGKKKLKAKLNKQ